MTRRFVCRLLGAVVVLSGTAARADQDGRFSVGVEVGGGSMLSSYQRDTLHYDKDFQAALTAGLRLVENLDAEVAVRGWWFPSDAGYGRSTLLGAGLRYWFLDGDVGGAFVNANLGLGVNGGTARFMFDAGLGYAFHVGEGLEVGPALRYGQVAAGGSDDPYSAKFWSIGLTALYRFGSDAAPAPAGPGAPAGVEPAEPPHPVAAAPAKAVDRDGDGIDDLHDACPDVPQGAVANPDQLGCPDGDFDKDGVFDHKDQCPAEAAGLHPDPAKPGCALSDLDHDTVPDVEDHCPDKAGSPSPDPRRNGCPGLAQIEGGKIEIKKPVFFGTGSDKLLPKSFPVLTAVADALRATPNIRRIDVQGHTDAQGKAETNLELSQRRAEAVRRWLGDHGVEADRLEAHGFGGSRPVSTNKTGPGRAANRRVEFLILDPASSGAELPR